MRLRPIKYGWVVLLAGLGALVALAVLRFGPQLLRQSGDSNTALGSRLPELEMVVTHLRGMPEGPHAVAELPAEARLPRLLEVYVDGRGAYAMEFASELTIDLDPAFVYIDFDTPDPEGAAREVCRKSGLTFCNPFREKGWYRATGL
jgi:hypothetical protein